MNAAQRERLRENLRARLAGETNGIALDTPFHWLVEGIKQPGPFFAGLRSLIPPDSILYFEGCGIAPEVAGFYERHPAIQPTAVVRDTLFPDPDTYHVAFSSEVIAGLQELAASRLPQELGDHIKAYQAKSVLFTFHDAFDGWLMISEHVNPPAVAEFCRCLGVSYRREQTKQRDAEQLRAFLNALEHPEKLRFKHERWWKRWWTDLANGFKAGWKDPDA